MKHPNILATTIAIAPFYTPPPAYGEASEVVLGTPPPDEAIVPQVGALAGDVEPDWGDLEKRFGGDEKPPDAIKAADPTEIDPKTPVIPQEPAKPAETPPKAPETPAAAPETPKAPEVKPADATKPTFDPAEELKKVDAAQISPKASSATKDGFETVKGVAKRFATENETLRAQVAELQKRGGMTPELEAEVKALREFRDTWGVEHDPEFLKPFNEKLGKADDGFIASLLDPEIGLPKTDADAAALNGGLYADQGKTLPVSEETLRKVGIDSPQGKQIVGRILGILRQNEDPLLYEKAMDGIRARRAVLTERDAKIAEVKEKQGGYTKAQEERAKQEMQQYGLAADRKLIELFRGNKWAEEIKPAPDATPEAKANAEAHNKWLKEGLIPEIRNYLGAIWNRDPDGAMVAVYKAVAHDQIAKERDALAAEKTQLEARIAELSKTAQGVRQVAAAPTKQSAPVAPGKEVPKLNQTADEAIDEFLATRAK